MEFWRNCSSCKKEIYFESKYYECSVSTCRGRRTGYVFCSVSCFERHLPGARHRDAGAVECKAPSLAAWERELAAGNIESPSMSSSGPVRRIIVSNPNSTGSSSKSVGPLAADGNQGLSEDEVLIVVSKLKNYIREKSEMNTSGDVPDVLSQFVRRLCDGAIEEARRDGRKTVMARDFKRN